MAPPNPVISPDGAYYWDGQAWKPMPQAAPAAPSAPPQSEADRPSWLPAADARATPAAFASPPSAPTYVTTEVAASPPSPPATPLWVTPAPAGSDTRFMVMAAAGVILVLLVGIAGYSIYQSRSQDTNLASTTSTATPSADASPTAPASPVVQQPLTAQLGGEYCPVAHVNNTSCWHGSLTDTGPRIGKLALIFVSGGGYTNWFTTHSNPALSGFYTTAGCDLDVPSARMVCGSVAPGGEITVYLIGDTTKRGTFHYAVKFADISSGTPVYVDQNPDGTHQVVSWYEKIT
jgi:hypothetical protein